MEIAVYQEPLMTPQLLLSSFLSKRYKFCSHTTLQLQSYDSSHNCTSCYLSLPGQFSCLLEDPVPQWDQPWHSRWTLSQASTWQLTDVPVWGKHVLAVGIYAANYQNDLCVDYTTVLTIYTKVQASIPMTWHYNFCDIQTNVTWNTGNLIYVPPSPKNKNYDYLCTESTLSPAPSLVRDLSVISYNVDSSDITLSLRWSPPSTPNGILTPYNICIGAEPLESDEEVQPHMGHFCGTLDVSLCDVNSVFYPCTHIQC